MPGVHCCVKCCKSKYYSGSSNAPHFFRFPKDKEIAKVWALLINRTDILERNVLNYRVCSIHFEDRMYSDKSKTRILPKAVPSLYLESKNRAVTNRILNLKRNKMLDFPRSMLEPLLHIKGKYDFSR